MKKIIFQILCVAIFQGVTAQNRTTKSIVKPNLNLKETYVGKSNISDACIKDTLLVYIYFPKKLFSIQEIEKILKRENHLMEVSSQSIVQKTACTENLITNTRYLSSCWIKDQNPKAKSLVAANYNLVKGSNEDFHTIRATIDYKGLAPKTALVSVFLNKQYLENLQAGNWSVNDKTICTFSISESRWPEFVFQAGGACVRGFAVRGYAGDNSICSTVPKNVVVEFWVSKNTD
jgi:hypothetical protein